MRLSSESFEAEQKNFGLRSFHELNMRLSGIHIPCGWIIWQPDTSTLNFVNLTSTQPIIVQNSISIDDTLHVFCYHHGTRVDFQIIVINDIRQINTLIDLLTNYSDTFQIVAMLLISIFIIFTNECPNPEVETQQALPFISGYAAFSVMKSSSKPYCVSSANFS